MSLKDTFGEQIYLYLPKPQMSFLCHLKKCDIFYIKKVKKVREKTG